MGQEVACVELSVLLVHVLLLTTSVDDLVTRVHLFGVVLELAEVLVLGALSDELLGLSSQVHLVLLHLAVHDVGSLSALRLIDWVLLVLARRRVGLLLFSSLLLVTVGVLPVVVLWRDLRVLLVVVVVVAIHGGLVAVHHAWVAIAWAVLLVEIVLVHGITSMVSYHWWSALVGWGDWEVAAWVRVLCLVHVRHAVLALALMVWHVGWVVARLHRIHVWVVWVVVALWSLVEGLILTHVSTVKLLVGHAVHLELLWCVVLSDFLVISHASWGSWGSSVLALGWTDQLSLTVFELVVVIFDFVDVELWLLLLSHGLWDSLLLALLLVKWRLRWITIHSLFCIVCTVAVHVVLWLDVVDVSLWAVGDIV